MLSMPAWIISQASLTFSPPGRMHEYPTIATRSPPCEGDSPLEDETSQRKPEAEAVVQLLASAESASSDFCSEEKSSALAASLRAAASSSELRRMLSKFVRGAPEIADTE